MTGTFEDACRRVEAAATSLEGTARSLQRGAAGLRKAAATGDVSRIRSEAERLRTLGAAAHEAANNAAAAWPLDDATEESYLASGYRDELVASARERQVKIQPYGEGFVAFPCLVTIDSRGRGVRINRRRLKGLRPSVVAAEIAAAQTTKPRFAPNRFIEVLSMAYQLVTAGDTRKGAILTDVYHALTLLPDSRRDYPMQEFVRDVHLLNRSGVTKTRQGQVLHLPASTGTKDKTNVLEIVDEHGERHLYFGIRFEEDAP